MVPIKQCAAAIAGSEPDASDERSTRRDHCSQCGTKRWRYISTEDHILKILTESRGMQSQEKKRKKKKISVCICDARYLYKRPHATEFTANENRSAGDVAKKAQP
jgi:hypothetical protein